MPIEDEDLCAFCGVIDTDCECEKKPGDNMEEETIDQEQFTIEERWIAKQLQVGKYEVKRRRDSHLDEGKDWIRKNNVITLTRKAADLVAQCYSETLEALEGITADPELELTADGQPYRLAMIHSNTQKLHNRRVLKIKLYPAGEKRPECRVVGGEDQPQTEDTELCRVRNVKLFVHGQLVPVIKDEGSSTWRLVCRQPRVRGRIHF